MEYIYTIILGVVQGITEFAPVSSSGHLVLLHEWFKLDLSSELVFDVALHAGTLFAIIVFFTKDIIHYIKHSPKLLWLFVLSSIPAAIVGFFLEDIIDEKLRSVWVVVIMLVLVAIIFLVVERKARQRIVLDKIGWKQALTIGFAQMLSLIPGTSRSGITISTGMALGLSRVDATRFSFLMAIPIFLGVTGKKGIDLIQQPVSKHEMFLILIGFVISFVVGMVVIRYLLVFFKRYSLRPFAWYRIVLAVVVTIVFIL
ncbi:MAG: undecaprenyl-diphosphate phosphatase [bacterium]|nr:undecaprenyl-diphosphate phosphatase [bacterium]